MSDLITVGQIGGAFGVRGELRIKSFCADPASIVDYGPYSTPAGGNFAELVLTGQAKGGFTARLDGVTTKEQADALKGVELQVPRDRLPQLPDDEFYYTDLIGLTVRDTGGETIGTVRAVQNHGAGDLLELSLPGASTTVLLPFTQENVPTVDLATRTVIADPPEGLLPDQG